MFLLWYYNDKNTFVKAMMQSYVSLHSYVWNYIWNWSGYYDWKHKCSLQPTLNTVFHDKNNHFAVVEMRFVRNVL